MCHAPRSCKVKTEDWQSNPHGLISVDLTFNNRCAVMVSLNKTNFKLIVKLYINNPDKLVLNGNGKHSFLFFKSSFFLKR